MKKTAILAKIGFKLKKHSPEILIIAGIVGTVASTVMACKATTKLSAIMDKTPKTLRPSIKRSPPKNRPSSTRPRTQRRT